MKLLFAANRFPYPPYRGDKLKIYHLARILSKHHTLHLITFLENEDDRQYIPELEQYFEKIFLVPHPKSKAYINTAKALIQPIPLQVGYFQSAAMKAEIATVLSQEVYDGVHIQHLRLLPYWKEYKDLYRILDLPDAYSLYWKRRVAHSSGLKKLFNKLEYRKVLAYESELSHFDRTLVCSTEDAQYLQTFKQLDNVSILPNGVDTTRFYPREEHLSTSYNILFTGNMDYAPNVDAVSYFARDIFPLIKTEVPDAKFIIAGQRPVSEVTALANEDISVTGFIPDLTEAYHQADIVVAPLRYGAGTQNKVLEAMACGIPVITRNIGFDGIGVSSGNGVILAMTELGFAEECTKLLKDKNKAIEVGQKGYEYIKNHLDWDIIGNKLIEYFTR